MAAAYGSLIHSKWHNNYPIALSGHFSAPPSTGWPSHQNHAVVQIWSSEPIYLHAAIGGSKSESTLVRPARSVCSSRLEVEFSIEALFW